MRGRRRRAGLWTEGEVPVEPEPVGAPAPRSPPLGDRHGVRRRHGLGAWAVESVSVPASSPVTSPKAKGPFGCAGPTVRL